MEENKKKIEKDYRWLQRVDGNASAWLMSKEYELLNLLLHMVKELRKEA